MKKLLFMLPLLFFVSAIFAQNQDPSSKRILGNWYSKTNLSIKWTFTQDGRVYNYNQDRMAVMYKYTISHSCQNFTDDTEEFITLMDKDGNQFCFKINGINENKNGILSLTNLSNMQQLIFVNDANSKVAQ
ncbi:MULTISPECIES: hypothetical protein [Flavobacterium]|uniref:Lipocalin-like domain-containing protein n=1 Tax=Flavobacterium anhuiense TaxID=459526 RepID=A0ABY0LNC6_9FLAO|nr:MULTISPECIES: hypothetical protein [Flavobacterium]EJG02392.1 hypothetical protein FF52_06915 [Flavobacterium sp. F52]SCY42693.1 hypothetical protein SAMN02927916_2030 [Flavobacterium anhuiense]